MAMRHSACRWCATVFRNLRPGANAPTHNTPGTSKKCPGSGQKTGAHVDD